MIEDLKFTEVSADPGRSVRATIYPESGCQPVWFRVPAALADAFVVTNLRINRKCQLGSAGAVPASLFSDSAPGDELLLDWVEAGQPLEITATNISSQNMPFHCRPIFKEPGERLARYRRARVVGLGVTLVPPEGTVRIVVQPQLELVPDRLHVSPDVLDNLVVRNLEVRTWREGEGADGYLSRVWPGRLSTDYLREGGWFPHLSGIVVGPGRCLVVHVENKTQVPATFTGAVLGAEPC